MTTIMYCKTHGQLAQPVGTAIGTLWECDEGTSPKYAKWAAEKHPRRTLREHYYEVLTEDRHGGLCDIAEFAEVPSLPPSTRLQGGLATIDTH